MRSSAVKFDSANAFQSVLHVACQFVFSLFSWCFSDPLTSGDTCWAKIDRQEARRVSEADVWYF